MTASIVDLSFPHRWQAEILPARPLILPPRHFVYPRQAEEVERGALEVLIRPCPSEMYAEEGSVLKGHGFSRAGCQPISGAALAAEGAQVAENTFPQGLKPGNSFCDVCGTAEAVPFQGSLPGASGPGCTRTGLRSWGREPASSLSRGLDSETWEGKSARPTSETQPFLITCALGFRDPAVPTGIWSAPRPEEICAVSGGYAYLIDTSAPERFTMIAFRPVLEVRPAVAQGLLLFVGHHGILAWGANGQAWQSEKLSSEGVTITNIDGCVLHGLGWDLMTDKETPFALDLRTGLRVKAES